MAPRTLQTDLVGGYLDEDGNYHPNPYLDVEENEEAESETPQLGGYYDPEGNYHPNEFLEPNSVMDWISEVVESSTSDQAEQVKEQISEAADQLKSAIDDAIDDMRTEQGEQQDMLV